MSKLLEYQKHSPPTQLQEFVKYIWTMKAYEDRSAEDLLIPDGYPEIIFVKRGAYNKAFIGEKAASTTIRRSCVIGIQTRSVLASRLDRCHLVGAKLLPVGAYALFGHRLKQIADANVCLADFGLDWLQELDVAVKDCQDDSVLIDLISSILVSQIEQLPADTSLRLASSFLASVLAVKGQLSVGELAKQHHLSVRHFQRKFKDFFGISPKKFLNIIRFKQLYKSSVLQDRLPADFLDYGYYDQMHFIKDFQKQLGISPSRSLEPFFSVMNQMARRNR
ncbi:MAG: helix-turn-helix transcriptional regulator [Bacteroidota bacterium]